MVVGHARFIQSSERFSPIRLPPCYRACSNFQPLQIRSKNTAPGTALGRRVWSRQGSGAFGRKKHQCRRMKKRIYAREERISLYACCECLRFSRKRVRRRLLGKQLLRSVTSIGANYREAYRARSKAEFIANECDELTAIFVTILRRSKGV